MATRAPKLPPERGPRSTARKARGDGDRLYPGRPIGPRYRLERPLDPRGAVWLAVDSDGTRVAPKTGPRALIEREHRLTASLRHPHVVSVDELIECDAGVFSVREYLGGGDLVSLAGLRPRHWLAPVGMLVSVLAFLHERGIAHRDVKARNVMFDDRESPRLIDFASAASIGSAFSRGGTTIVAPGRDTGPVTAGDDLYALAALLHELIFGTPVFTKGARPALAVAGPLARVVDERLNAEVDADEPGLARFEAVIKSTLDAEGILT
jgi:serine/threonine protein kinase